MRILLLIAFVFTATLTTLTLTPTGSQVATLIVAETDAYQQCLDSLASHYPELQQLEERENLHVLRRQLEVTNNTPDLIFQLTDAKTCGTTGCIYELCLRDQSASRLVPFSLAGQKLEVLESSNNGMYDLRLTTTDQLRLEWDGEHYVAQSN